MHDSPQQEERQFSPVRVGRKVYPPETRVRVKGIADPWDADLNGREGILVYPFRGFPTHDRAGRRYAAGVSIPIDGGTSWIKTNVHEDEFEVIA